MKYTLVAAVFTAAIFVLAGAGLWGVDDDAQAQSAPSAPAGLTVANGPEPGTVILSWTAVPGTTNHRIGWLADEDYQAYLANDVWRQKFAYSDVVAADTYTLARLTPGIKYWLIVGSQAGLAWSAWKDLVLNSDTMACPADAGAGTPMPTPRAGDVNTDRAALGALYTTTSGSNWKDDANWLSNRPLGEWRGVSTDADGRVTQLSLGDNRLSGSIPPELGNLANLESLYLGDNRLSGSIPPELGNLANLESLYLRDNRLSGSIPPELGNLANLEALWLDDNQLSGSIPPELSSLANLKLLWLHGNQLSGSIPPELGNLANLETLYLDGNQLSGSIPPELGNLANLEMLSIHGNQLSGSIPPELGNLANLETLSLVLNRLSGTIPSELGNLAYLERLKLGGNRLSGTIPTELGNLSNLESLSLGGNQLSGTIPSELGSLANLRSLSLNGNRLSGTIPTELGNLSNLESLSLGGNQLSGCVPAALLDVPQTRFALLLSLWSTDVRAPATAYITSAAAAVPEQTGLCNNHYVNQIKYQKAMHWLLWPADVTAVVRTTSVIETTEMARTRPHNLHGLSGQSRHQMANRWSKDDTGVGVRERVLQEPRGN